MGTRYDEDVIAWANEQAALLRAGKLDKIDLANVAEELETLARAMERELYDRLARLLQNLAQWHLLPLVQLPAWYIAIQEERAAIPRLLDDATTLRDILPETYAEAWERARDWISYATGMRPDVIPTSVPFTCDQALDTAFWPGESHVAAE